MDGLRWDRATDDLTPLPVLLCLPRSERSFRKDDVRIIRSDLAPEDVLLIDGVPVTSPVRTAFDLARTSKFLDDAVGLADALLAAAPVGRDELAHYLREHKGWRGVIRARQVFDLVDPATKSFQESRMRVLWVTEAGLPRPLVNCSLLDRRGLFLAEVDLFDPASGLVGEFDGAVHSGAEKRAADHFREERMERVNLRVVRLTSPDLGRQRRRSVVRLQAEHASGLARDRSKDGWRLAPPQSGSELLVARR